MKTILGLYLAKQDECSITCNIHVVFILPVVINSIRKERENLLEFC